MVVVVVVLVGFFAMRSRGNDDNNGTINTIERKTNCSPIARADAAATRPGEPVLVDVLANDTDPDGDALVFQILKADGGTAAIDDGGTPTDSADDRLAFTPADPPVDNATVEYQALDPQGAFSAASLTVAVNPQALLPDGVRSALATDPPAEGSESAGCGEPETTTTTLDAPVDPEAETTTTVVLEDDESTTATTSGRRTATTRKPSSSSGGSRTTTTRKASGGSGTTNTTSRPNNQTPTTDAPSVTAPGEGGGGTTTTRPPSTTKPDPKCGTPQNNPNFNQCMRDNYSTTSTSAP